MFIFRKKIVILPVIILFFGISVIITQYFLFNQNRSINRPNYVQTNLSKNNSASGTELPKLPAFPIIENATYIDHDKNPMCDDLSNDYCQMSYDEYYFDTNTLPLEVIEWYSRENVEGWKLSGGAGGGDTRFGKFSNGEITYQLSINPIISGTRLIGTKIMFKGPLKL